jgi:hypothetical protein
LHTLGVNLRVNLGVLDKAPTIYPHDYKGKREAGSFQANGTEIGKVKWAEVSEIVPTKPGIYSYQNIPFAWDYSPALHTTIKQTRDDHIASHTINKFGRPVFISQENVINSFANKIASQPNAEKIIADVIGQKPKGEFGPEALSYQHRLLKLAKYMQKQEEQGKAIDVEQLKSELKSSRSFSERFAPKASQSFKDQVAASKDVSSGMSYGGG